MENEKVIFNSNVKQITHLDLGCSEDEFNNFLIDCHLLLKELDKPQKKSNKPISPIAGKSVTVHIKPPSN